ncbi:unnamed protein product [Anisakis simplex]|uniref:Secreted protein n=1 Tax=Anisakis simplex TaxID=6269 RepID=A0A0M3JX66_ANISI|nr:unnamed protein product [Anisakis simplex]
MLTIVWKYEMVVLALAECSERITLASSRIRSEWRRGYLWRSPLRSDSGGVLVPSAKFLERWGKKWGLTSNLTSNNS